MTRDELKEKVARAIIRQRLERSEGPGNDTDQAYLQRCENVAWRGCLRDAEAVLSAIEAAGMAVVPVEATGTTDGAFHIAIAKWLADEGEDGDVYAAMVEAGRVR